MTNLIIHIGYPKTATKTFQWGLFPHLHSRGHINYAVGQRSQEADGGVLRYWKTLAEGKLLDRSDIPLQEDRTNLLSCESHVTGKNFANAQGNTGVVAIDPCVISHRLKSGLRELRADPHFLVVIRAQQTLLHSFYVQKLSYFLNDPDLDTFDKWLSHHLGGDPRDDFKMFNFYYVLNCYQCSFPRSRIKFFLYEDLKNDPDDFLKRMCSELDVDVEEDSEAWPNWHYHKKPRTRDGDGYRAQIMEKRLFGALVSALGFSRLMRSERLARLPWARRVRRLVAPYLQRNREVSVPFPTDEQRVAIRRAFRDSNLKLCRRVGLDRTVMEAYGYI